LLKFHFDLTPLDQMHPWEEKDGRKYLHWFGLTYGHYWIELGSITLFCYTKAIQEKWGLTDDPPYPDYQVARLWEDLLQILPFALSPVPEDIASLAADAPAWDAYRTYALDSDEWERLGTAVWWWDHRRIDSFHLVAAPLIWLWRVGDIMHLRWDSGQNRVEGVQVFTADGTGEHQMPVTTFLDAVLDFDARLIDRMAKRIAAIRTGWSREHIHIDLPALERQQEDRASWYAQVLEAAPRLPVDWDEVRAALAEVQRLR
jgi:hypothetical protein